MSDPADEPMYEQLGDKGNPFTEGGNPDALIEGNRVGTAEDMESSEKPGYEGEAPNLPLADQGMRDGTPVDGGEPGADGEVRQ